MAINAVCPSFPRALRRAGGLFFAFSAAVLVSCNETSNMTSLEVPLTFNPEAVCSGQYDDVPISPDLKLYVAPVVDERSIKDKIGQNTELPNRDPRPITAAGSDPADFLHGVVVKELGCAGITPVASAAEANRTLTLHLRRFFTNESSLYHGEIRVTAEVRDQSGTVLWEGRSSGKSSRFGRSMSQENYQQTFSDAALELVGNLLDNTDFQKAMAMK